MPVFAVMLPALEMLPLNIRVVVDANSGKAGGERAGSDNDAAAIGADTVDHNAALTDASSDNGPAVGDAAAETRDPGNLHRGCRAAAGKQNIAGITDAAGEVSGQ